ncbi:MAG: tetratricopeptide repeat protein [Bacteroidota bacterium]
MRIKSIFLFITLNLLQHLSISKSNVIDSLQSVLKTAKEDTAKVNILNGLAFEFRNNNPDTTIYFAKEALALATKLNYKLGIANSYLNLSSVMTNLGQFEEALKNVNEAIVIYDQLLASEEFTSKSVILKQKARAYSNVGNIHFSQGNYSEAMKENTASLEIRKEIGDKAGIASAYNNIGNIYGEMGNYPEALKTYLASLKAREEMNDKERIGASYNNIGNIYYRMNNFPEALKNHYASLKINEEMGNKSGTATSYNNIGGINTLQGNYGEALKNNFAALKIYEETGNKSGISIAYVNIAGVYLLQNNYPDALTNSFAALKFEEETGDKHNMANIFIVIGNIYVRQKKNKEAWLYMNKGLMLSKEIGSNDYIRNAYDGLSTVDSAQGNYKEAFEHYKLFVAYRDSLFNEENTKKVVQSQMQYDFDKKESIAKATQEKKDVLAEGEAKRQRTIRNSTFAGLALVLVFFVVVYRQRNKISREKKRSDLLVAEKEMLIKEIHHRVKNNLEVISSLLELQSEGMNDSKAKAAVMEGQSRVQSIALIHHKLYRTDDVASVEFKNFVSDLYKQVEDVFKKQGAGVEFKIIADETKISIDAAVPLGLILNELLTNTFKYAISENKKNEISIQLNHQSDDGKFLLVFKDNGPGMPPEYDLQKSTSLGMKVIQLLTKQLGGKLNFYNDGGSVFEIPFKILK